MARVCYICGKGTKSGRNIKRRGKAKKEGGVGRRITGTSKRTFKPNLQKIKAEIDGSVKRITVCTKCLKAGKVKKVA
jgi:large subunit ribosomal protein L28